MAGASFIEEVIDFSIGRVAVRRTIRNEPSQGTVLLINGAIATISTARWAEKGLQNFDLVAFDFPNMGRSRAMNQTLGVVSKEDEARLVLEFIERYRIDHLISTSWGGSALLLTLLAKPPHVRSAIVASFSLGVQPRLATLSRQLLAFAAIGDRAGAADLIINGLGEFLSEGLKRVYRSYFLDLDDLQLAYAAEQIRYVMAQEAEGYLKKFTEVDIPILFLNGGEDRYTPPESVRAIGGYLTNSLFHVVPGAGHFLTNESRATFHHVCEVVNGFLVESVTAQCGAPRWEQPGQGAVR